MMPSFPEISMKKITLIALAATLLAVSCKHKEEEKVLQYYATPNPYEIVDVTMPPVDNEVRNVIIMIGDGMGLEQVSCAWVVNHGKLNLDRFPTVGLSRTYCTNELITDSGAGGTALSSGIKTAYSHVGTAADYVTCGVDYLAGGGLDWFTVNRKDGRDITKEMAAAGYTVALTENELMAAELPVIGILAPDNLPIAMERGDLYRRSVARGLDILSRESGDKGFVMMLEGSCIDDWLHGNDIGKAMEELLDFDRTIGDVLEWAAADGHTLVVVTADHNTGALTMQDGNLEEGRIGVAFGSESHNGIAVPFYAWGPGSDAFTGIRENDEWGRLIASFVK